MAPLFSPAARAAAKREGEALQRYGEAHRETHRRWNEAIAKAEAAKREAAEREARRRRRRRAAKRSRAAARAIAKQQRIAERDAAECKAVGQRGAIEKKAKAKPAGARQKPRQEQHKKDDVERVQMTDSDIEWAKEAWRDDKAKGFGTLEAAYSRFTDRWGKSLERRERKVPGRTQFRAKIWLRRID